MQTIEQERAIKLENNQKKTTHRELSLIKILGQFKHGMVGVINSAYKLVHFKCCKFLALITS